MNKRFSLLNFSCKAKISERALGDLGFDLIGETIFAESQGLFKSFLRVLGAPVAEREILLERQRIYLDFCKYPFLLDDILEYCDRAAEFYLTPFGKTFRTVHDRLKYYLSNTLDLISVYDSFPKVLGNLSFSSYTIGEYKQESCSPLKKELEKLISLYGSSDFSVNVEFNDGFKLKSASLNRAGNIEILPVYIGNKKRKGAEILPFSEDYVFFGNNSVVYNVANEIKTSMILNLCGNISSINSAIKDFFVNLRGEVEFYKAALKLKKYMEEKNIDFCMPKIVNIKNGIHAKDLYDLGLAALLDKNIISNDVSMDKGKILIVTGHNRGGKTTFLKSIGIAQILAQAGLFVPAKEYFCPIYQGILTHFPAGEDEDLNYGKLAEELVRLHEDFHVLKGGGLALFNEPFTTTTTHEGSEIGIDVLRAVCASGSHAVFVTHLMELAKSRSLLGETVSLTTENADSYKIVESEPLEDISAYDML